MITIKDLTQYMIGTKPANTGDLSLLPWALEVKDESCVVLCIPVSQMEKWEREMPK